MSASDTENLTTVVSAEDTDLAKLSAEELLAVVATLRQENKTLLKSKNKVGLTFKRIPEDGNDSIARLEAGEFPYLTKIDSLSVTKGEKTDGNIALIEGENLAVLAALQMTHKGKVDVIYIDPPYNTGNDDFIYEDKRMYKSEASDLENLEETLDGKTLTVGKDDPFRHSKWLSFMERRLFLAKELLSDTGVIFVSIDDNEQARLKLLMDSVFGGENFIANIAASYNPKGRSTTKFFADNHEYILVYTKSYMQTSLTPTSKSLVKTSDYKLKDSLGVYRLLPLLNTSKEFTPTNRPNLAYPIYVNPKTFNVSLTADEDFTIPVLPFFSTGEAGVWRWGKEKANNEIWKLLGKKIKDKWIIQRKDHLTEDKAITLKTHLNYEMLGTSDESNRLLSSILGNKEFDYPKSLKAIKLIISMMPKKDALVLDFFAGSGTTGHAVAELNKEDGGNRSAILVTNNEGGIARNVTRERLARTLTGKNWADGKEHEPLQGNLSYYTLDFNKLSANPLTTAQKMERNFDGLLSLENNTLDVIENNPDEDYAIYRDSGKVVFVWKNLFSLYDGECEELLESLKNKVKVEEFIAYVPSESIEPAISVDGWQIISFPHGYIERYEAMIATMRRNQTLPNAK